MVVILSIIPKQDQETNYIGKKDLNEHYSNKLDELADELAEDWSTHAPTITIEAKVDLIEVVRHFSKMEVMLVAQDLAKNPRGKTFSEIRDNTGLATNTLNRTLNEMKRDGFIHTDGKLRNRTYKLTKIGLIMVFSMQNLFGAIESISRSNLMMNIAEEKGEP